MDQPERTSDFQSMGSSERPLELETELPLLVGRYRIERQLGRGSFGVVYLGHDDQLQRPVAIKVPHRKLVDRPETAEAYLTEARTVANLDHPNIVPVHDVGSTDDCPVFIVSKYIDGTDLAARLKQSRLSQHEAVDLVATVAEALHFAHKQGLVHRDIKPGNLLLDRGGKPFVADFGLALREQDVGKGPRYAGTPAYMSPEQARGEGHRVDGRSDIFTLGVVFYELLAGRQPFRGDSLSELMDQVATHEPRPLRQMDESIPKELERICFKAIAKRASERYMTAKDFADDLRHFLAEQPSTQLASGAALARREHPSQPDTSGLRSDARPTTTPTSDHQPIKIVPKGLRSFDAHDADFFLELLPGPRDRDGLPDSLRFWKTRIEEMNAENTFAVGLIYGPSGCGKSSLVKAGLLPRLSEDVIAVYVEATAEETETRLLNGLRKKLPALENRPLKETLATLRRGMGIPVGKKVVIVLDQFEQWLHAKKEEQDTELVQALRQCDGGRVQCVVMVRDDFWLAVSRFMRDLEVRLVEAQNSALVDLFDLDHARKVLSAFGRAFGKLPESSCEMTREQKEFLNLAVAGLAQEGKVISVRLALFAEMMKGKAWTPASLKAVGGTEGVGVTFLEETFSASTAPPEHRYHQKAARAVLKALLPESGAEIKGHMRSRAELLDASGYGGRQRDFDELIRILDSEVRLITPTDPEGKQSDDDSTSSARPGEKFYQLTHDYLVPSLRDWLTRKQKETRRGRAELLLADRAAVWNARPENRQLPSLLQWFQIRWLTAKKNWSKPQRKMMARAGRRHTARGLAFLLSLLLLSWVGVEVYARSLVDQIINAETTAVPAMVERLPPFRLWANARLHHVRESSDDAKEQLHASLALLSTDPSQVVYLYNRLLDAEPSEVKVIADALAPHKDEDALLDKLWAVVEQANGNSAPGRLQAASALASYDAPENPGAAERWRKAAQLITADLLAAVQKNPSHYDPLLTLLRPASATLLPPLTEVYLNQERPDSERSFATNILADYAVDNVQALAQLLVDADAKQFGVIYRAFQKHGANGLPLLAAVIDHKLPADVPSSDPEREILAKRQANAAVALLQLGQAEKVWPLLRHPATDSSSHSTHHPPPFCDPRVRSYLIHYLSPKGADAQTLIARFKEEKDVTIRRALLLALGEYPNPSEPRTSVSGSPRRPLPDGRGSETIGSDFTAELLALYRTHPDAGLHAAAEWLLRKWGHGGALTAIDRGLALHYALSHLPVPGALVPLPGTLQAQLARHSPPATRHPPPTWFVNGQGQTFIVIPGPVEFEMGSPTTETEREGGREGPFERQHTRRIPRTFAIAAKEVTVEQFLRFRKNFNYGKDYSRSASDPINAVTWYEAAEYCNWLSDQEGIPKQQWCYVANDQGKYADGMKAAPNYLRLSGYRLPTEAEWEYSCRAGALTARYYGETEDLLREYAWYTKNSLNRWLLPGGAFKPNDLGLHDVLGNALEWCHDEIRGPYPNQELVEDREKMEDVVKNDRFRVLRGGSFGDRAQDVRSSYRDRNRPDDRDLNVGFRPSRTYP